MMVMMMIIDNLDHDENDLIVNLPPNNPSEECDEGVYCNSMVSLVQKHLSMIIVIIMRLMMMIMMSMMKKVVTALQKHLWMIMVMMGIMMATIILVIMIIMITLISFLLNYLILGNTL